MIDALCPVCGEAVAFAPDGWSTEVIHSTHGRHVVITERPRPPHVIPSLPER
jgi:hypothetical protein